MLARLREIFAEVARRRDLGAVVLGGEGADFCAGVEEEEPPTLDAELVRAVCELIETCGVPVVLALDGEACGEGSDLALACHLRVAARGASLVSSDSITAEEAFRRGLVNRVVSRDELSAEAEALARSVIDNGAPLAARACLQAVTRGARLPLSEALALETQLFSDLFATRDAREGLRAFLEKRPPAFKGE